ncbi:MAG TPA: hypothetical protein PKZ52_11485, partial [Cellvibrionaceae bacterium]|nr:hypothetical protein [Cellvibrionaceae bacterium]
GDLQAYLLVQFLPMLIIPLILLLFPVNHSRPSAYWLLLVCYLLAKVCEHFDTVIYELGLGLSGHTLKHLIAAAGIFLLAVNYRRRTA